MRLWIIAMSLTSAVGVLAYFVWANDGMEKFLSGFLFGAPLGALFLRIAVNRWLKPEYFEKEEKRYHGNHPNHI